LQKLAALVGRANRYAASKHLEDVRQYGEDFGAFALRQRKVDASVRAGVLQELLATLLASSTALTARVKAQ
jgi:hypothetical protein